MSCFMRDTPLTSSEVSLPGVSVAPAGPFVVRRHAPGKPYVAWKNGGYTLVYPKSASYTPTLSWPERLRYWINAYLQRHDYQWHVPGSGRDTKRRSAAQRTARPTPASRAGRRPHTPLRAIAASVVRTTMRIVGFAFLGFLALMGVTRFVHVDEVAVLRSVHFSIPHFLTPWRGEAVERAPEPEPTVASAAYGFLTPPLFSLVPPESANAHPAHNWLPVPDGPLPFGMPVSGRAATPSLNLKSSTLFANPEIEDDDAEDSVTLLGQAATTDATAETPETVEATVAPVIEAVPQNPSRQAPPPEERRVTPTHKALSMPSTPNVAKHVVHPVTAPSRALAPTRLPADAGAQQRQPAPPAPDSRATVDVQLMPVATPATSVSVRTLDSGTGQPAADQSPGASDVRPKFNVITKTDDSLVVFDHGQMKQIPVGQTLPDGSTLTSVHGQGGGFSTSRGSYVAY